jgi:hypothetical protein
VLRPSIIIPLYIPPYLQYTLNRTKNTKNHSPNALVLFILHHNYYTSIQIEPGTSSFQQPPRAISFLTKYFEAYHRLSSLYSCVLHLRCNAVLKSSSLPFAFLSSPLKLYSKSISPVYRPVYIQRHNPASVI